MRRRVEALHLATLGAALVTILAIAEPNWFGWLIVVGLWLTVIFANLAEAVAEGRGKAQAATLRRAKQDTVARRLVGWRAGKARVASGSSFTSTRRARARMRGSARAATSELSRPERP